MLPHFLKIAKNFSKTKSRRKKKTTKQHFKKSSCNTLELRLLQERCVEEERGFCEG